jgi:hypothetical protein
VKQPVSIVAVNTASKIIFLIVIFHPLRDFGDYTAKTAINS